MVHLKVGIYIPLAIFTASTVVLLSFFLLVSLQKIKVRLLIYLKTGKAFLYSLSLLTV